MDVHELTAAYALDALDAEERDSYEAHLAQCERCRAELAELGDATTALALAVPSPAPPPELRARILEAAAGERENVVPLLRTRRAWVWRATAAVAAVAACAAIGLGIWAATLSHSLDQQRSARAAESRAMQIYMDPRSTKTALRGGSGTLAVDPTGQAALIVRNLPSAPSGKTYEAWVIAPGGKPARAGTFSGGGATTMFPLDQSVPQGAVVAATVEHAGGVERPTQTPVFSAQT